MMAVFRRVAILIGAIGWLSASLGNPVLAAESVLDEVLSRGKVRAAVTTGSPPFAFIDEKGELVGFDIDIARLIAKSLFGDPNAIELVRTSFDARWATVNTGRADFGIMITTIYPERTLKVAFTEAYVDSGNGCLVRKGSGIKTFADINKPNVTVALLNVAPDHKRREEFYPKAKALFFDMQAAQYSAVLSRQADAACTDRPFLQWVVGQHSDKLEMLPGTTAGTFNNAIFLKPGDFRWWLFLNTMVREMKHGSLYTDYNRLYQKWFGQPAPPQRYYQ